VSTIAVAPAGRHATDAADGGVPVLQFAPVDQKSSVPPPVQVTSESVQAEARAGAHSSTTMQASHEAGSR
jgi:hypothetical protein